VLKKAGIIVAATAAGLFAVAPLAFASPDDKGGDRTDIEYTQVDSSRNCEANNYVASRTDQDADVDQEARVDDVDDDFEDNSLLGIAAPINITANGLNNQCSPGANTGLLNLFD
jgi:hypothetical protein